MRTCDGSLAIPVLMLVGMLGCLALKAPRLRKLQCSGAYRAMNWIGVLEHVNNVDAKTNLAMHQTIGAAGVGPIEVADKGLKSHRDTRFISPSDLNAFSPSKVSAGRSSRISSASLIVS